MTAAIRANNPLITPAVITNALSIVDTGKLDPTLSQSAATTQILSQVMTTISSQTRIPVQDLVMQFSIKQQQQQANNTASNGANMNGSGGNTGGTSVPSSSAGQINKNVTK